MISARAWLIVRPGRKSNCPSPLAVACLVVVYLSSPHDAQERFAQDAVLVLAARDAPEDVKREARLLQVPADPRDRVDVLQEHLPRGRDTSGRWRGGFLACTIFRMSGCASAVESVPTSRVSSPSCSPSARPVRDGDELLVAHVGVQRENADVSVARQFVLRCRSSRTNGPDLDLRPGRRSASAAHLS